MKNKILAIVGVLILSLGLFGCGGSYSDYKGDYSNGIEYDGYEPNDGGYSYESQKPSTGGSNSLIKVETDNNQKLVYSCNLSLETLHFEDTIKQLGDLIEKYDGFVQSESRRNNSNGWYYSSYEKTRGTLLEDIVIRIPTKNYTEFLAEAGNLGQVMNQSQNVKNITTEYNDTAVTIESLKIQEQRLLEMMKDAQYINDMLEIESRLASVQKELSIYQSHMNTMNNDVEYSTITMEIEEVMEYTPEEVKPVTFMEKIQKALKESGETFVEILQDLVIGTIYAVPTLIAISIVPCIILVIVIVCVKNHKKKKQLKQVINVQPRDSEEVEQPSENIEQKEE